MVLLIKQKHNLLPLAIRAMTRFPIQFEDNCKYYTCSWQGKVRLELVDQKTE